MRLMLLTTIAAAMAVLYLPGPASAGEPYTRWAILSSPELQESGLADLVTAELSQVKGVQLVERDQLAAAMKELELDAVLGEADVRARLRLGRLVKADALIVLTTVAVAPEALTEQPITPDASALTEPARQADPLVSTGQGRRRPSRSRTFIKIVIADCQQGARLSIDFIAREPSQEADASRRVVQAVERAQRRFPSGIEKVIGLSHFVCRNFTHDYDRYQAGFAYLLESGLSRMPGVAVIETEQARSIRRENEMAGDDGVARVLPLFVEGEYEIARTDGSGTEVVTIEVRVRDGAGRQRTIRRQALAMAAAASFLASELPGQVLDSAGASSQPFTPAQQFEALVARAEAFALLGSFEEAACLREAALLLDPDASDQRIKAVEEYTHTVWAPLPDEVSKWWVNEKAYQSACAHRMGYWRLALEHLERVVVNQKLDQLVALRLARNLLSEYRHAAKEQYARYEDLPAIEQVRRAFLLKVYPRILDLPVPQMGKVKPAYARYLLYGSWNAFLFDAAFAPFAGEPLDISRDGDFMLQILRTTRPDIGPPSRSCMICLDRISGAAVAREDARAGWLDFIDKLANSQVPQRDLLVRYCRLVYKTAYFHSHPDSVDAGALADADALVADGKAYLDTIEVSSHALFITKVEGLRDMLQRSVKLQVGAESAASQPPVEPAATQASDGLVSRLRFVPVELRVREGDRPDPLNQPLQEMFDHVWRCTDSLDVFTSQRRAYLMRTRGLLEPLAPDEEYRAMDVKWDGRFIWIAVREKGLWVFRSDGRRLAQIGEAQGLPPIERDRAIPVRLHPLSPGRVLAIGNYGLHRRTWCAAITLDNDEAAVSLIYTAKRVLQEREDREPFSRSLDVIFVPTWLLQCPDPQDPSRQVLLVGRPIFQDPRRRQGPALQIDLQTLKVSLTDYDAPYDGFSAGGGVWRIFSWHQPKRSVLSQWRGPGNANEQDKIWRTLTELPNTECAPPYFTNQTLLCGDWLVWKRVAWSRVNIKTGQFEWLNKGLLPEDRRFSHNGISGHYGILCWGSSVSQPVYQVFVEDSPTIPLDAWANFDPDLAVPRPVRRNQNKREADK